MRIIDGKNRKDFYDGCQAWQIDPSITYIREYQEISNRLEWQKVKKHWQTNPKRDSKLRFAVGFCGNIYFGYEEYIGFEKPHNICYSYDNIINKGNIKREWWDFYESSLHHWFNGETSNYKGTTKAKFPDYFSKYNTPVWVQLVDYDILYVNPLLKDYEFFRVKDTYTAYIELSNYVGGVLQNPSKPMPSIDDETLASIKGFDKFSFRKDKST